MPQGQGSDHGSPKRPRARAIRMARAEVNVEFRKAVDPAEVVVAVEEIAARLRAELDADRAAA
jgi:hypothetical protein